VNRYDRSRCQGSLIGRAQGSAKWTLLASMDAIASAAESRAKRFDARQERKATAYRADTDEGTQLPDSRADTFLFISCGCQHKGQLTLTASLYDLLKTLS